MFAFGIPGRLTVTSYTDADRDQIEAQMGKTISDLKVEVNTFFEYWLLQLRGHYATRFPASNLSQPARTPRQN